MKLEDLRDIQWETLSDTEVLDRLLSGESGLSAAEAAKRLEVFGENKLPQGKRDGFFKKFFAQFNNALIYVLIGAAVLTAVMRDWKETWVILAVVLINAVIGYIQEDKAQKALDSIRNMLSVKASVIRAGSSGVVGARREVTAESLVPGDVVLLKAGDKIPADIRLINVSRFEVDESALTGESLAVTKSTGAVKTGTVLGERECMAYAGTSVRAGDASGVVVTTGGDTEIGKINRMLSETKATTTPLMKKMNSLGTVLSLIVLGFSVILFVYDVFLMGQDWNHAVLAVIGLAVAAIPEGLPAVLTITLAIGVQRMARKNSIIRRLPSVETLGAVTVICSDKTGTLTKNEMTVTNIYTASGEIVVDNPQSAIADNSFAKEALLERLIQCADLCNEADAFEDENGVWRSQGAPTEAALKVLARKYVGANCVRPQTPGTSCHPLSKGGLDSATKIADIPFDSEHKYRAALYEVDGKRIIFVNGASERIIGMCTQQAAANGTEPLNPSFWESKIEEAAGRGQRLLGLAYRVVEGGPNGHPGDFPVAGTADPLDELQHENLIDMIFSGIVGIIDPPRPEAIEAIRVCREAGIRVKMITGDHVLTAREIGRQMGIADEPKVISGVELETMDDEQIKVAAQEFDIFARTSPEHKLRLVKGLQKLGEVVAMTGDGVNDAPALKKADIGVAMGIKGTEVTKDSAEMVLADDNFSSIVSAVEEGRTIYDNIRKTLLYILPTNGAQALVIIAAILFNFTMPLTPVQVLWVNMVVAVTLSLAMAFEPTEENVMKRLPRNPKEPLLGKLFLFRIAFASVIVTALTLVIFFMYGNNGGDLAYIRTLAVNMLVFGQLFYLYNCRKFGSIFSRGFFRNKFAFICPAILVALQIGFTYLPFMQTWFGTVSLPLFAWIYFAAGGLIVLLVVEFEKVITNRIFGGGNYGKEVE